MARTYTSKQLAAYAKYVNATVASNNKHGTDYKPFPIDMFKWETCVICYRMICDDVFGNNPAPVKDEGDCCSKCNREVVVPARLAYLGLDQ